MVAPRQCKVPFRTLLVIALLCVLPMCLFVRASVGDGELEHDWKDEKVGSKTDSNVVQREAERISRLEASGEKFQFQAEVNRLMGIIINSLYTNNDIFLREVLSNASDALDKLRFLSLTDKAVLEGNPELRIRVSANPEKNELYIEDSGIGMTKEDLINNLGTIAQSGTKKFLQDYASYGDSTMIGQFGVGFYSVFLVADKVIVQSKNHASDKQWMWISDADNAFTVVEDPEGNTLGRGTRITLVLKEDASEYTNLATLRTLITKYSEFLNFPIFLWSSHEEDRTVDLSEEEVAAARAARDAAKEAEAEEEVVDLDGSEEADQEEEEDDVATTKTVKETVWDWERVNEVQPLWTRNAEDITEEEYVAFYKAISKDWQEPLKYVHFSAEGEIEFKSLLYIPSSMPSNMFDSSSEHKALKLYVRRVFITDDFESMLPRYLSFLKGIVDSDDLPLNVSREQLQQNRALKIIKKKIVRKAIAMFQELQEDEAEYAKFWEKFGNAIKYGIMEDASNKTRLSKLLMFHSNKTGALTLLDDYVARMKKGQDQIYFLACESVEKCSASPAIERAVRRGYEILYMVDPIDEYIFQHLPKYDGKYTLTNVARDGLKLPDDDKYEDRERELKDRFAPLVSWLKEKLPNIEKAVVSARLTTSPSALVSGSYGYTANMERIVRSQTLGDPSSRSPYMASKRILEINPRHPIVVELLNRVSDDRDDATAKDIAELLFDTAALTSGFDLADASQFAGRVHRMMKLGLNLDADAQAEIVEEEEADDAAPQDEEQGEEDEHDHDHDHEHFDMDKEEL